MGNPCFAGWLAQEVESAQNALLTRLEQLDTLRYVEAPKLRSEYMVKIGTVEDAVLETELNAKMLQRKLELIQIKRNRREPINMAEIDQQIEAERKELLEQAEAADTAGQPLQLTGKQQDELQALYHKIVENFHPQVHPNLTDTEKALYEKAVDAYRSRNLDALKLIDEILFKDNISIVLQASLSFADAEEDEQHAAALAETLTADYTLAKQLYPYFEPSQQDAVLRSAAERYTARREEIENEIEQLRQTFPFTAQATLADPEKTKAYLEQLSLRKLRALDAQKTLTQKINSIMEGLPHA